MITLRQPPPAWGLPNMSPFCVKLETYLRMAKIPYKVAPGLPQKGPKGRIPYIDLDGQRMGDTTFIIQTLKKKFGDSLDQSLTDDQRAMALALQSLVEDRLYFSTAYLRWADEGSWKHVREFLAPQLPPVLGGLILKQIRKQFIQSISDQGIGAHSRDEIVSIALEAITAISTLLGDKPYFLGNEPASIDATMYGFLIQLIWVPWESELKTHALGLKSIPAYCERMKQKYWS